MFIPVLRDSNFVCHRDGMLSVPRITFRHGLRQPLPDSSNICIILVVSRQRSRGKAGVSAQLEEHTWKMKGKILATAATNSISMRVCHTVAQTAQPAEDLATHTHKASLWPKLCSVHHLTSFVIRTRYSRRLCSVLHRAYLPRGLFSTSFPSPWFYSEDLSIHSMMDA